MHIHSYHQPSPAYHFPMTYDVGLHNAISYYFIMQINGNGTVYAVISTVITTTSNSPSNETNCTASHHCRMPVMLLNKPQHHCLFAANSSIAAFIIFIQ